MIRSSAIYYALFLSIIMGVILGSMVLLSALNKELAMKLELPARLMENAESGMAYAMVNHAELENGQQLAISLFDGEMDSVTLSKKYWGALTILQAKAHHKGQFFERTCIAGIEQKKEDVNLYVVDNGRQISIAGETRLEGNCYLPSGGLKRAYIAGENYKGSQLLYGSRFKANRSLPAINQELIEKLTPPQANIISWEEAQDSMVVNFSETPQQFISDGTISIDHHYLKGAIWIEAKDSVFIGRDCQIEEAVIKAPIIFVESGFRGNVQLLATKRITLEEEVLLEYPSVMAVVEESANNKQPAEIEVGEGTQVIGSVFMVREGFDQRNMPLLSIAKEAEIDGLVYCQGKTELKGTVNGSLYTQKFYLKTQSSSYENHILNGQVLDQLPAEFIYVDLLRNENEYVPLKQMKLIQ
ncbi:MAG: hypothetical protein MI810_22945 [Flavobacteriales bacterium]|nr:hypothetical protein [Flavobacteriales bacterium]